MALLIILVGLLEALEVPLNVVSNPSMILGRALVLDAVATHADNRNVIERVAPLLSTLSTSGEG